MHQIARQHWEWIEESFDGYNMFYLYTVDFLFDKLERILI